MSQSHLGTTPHVLHTVVAKTSRKGSSKQYRAKKSINPPIPKEEFEKLSFVELLEESSQKRDETQQTTGPRQQKMGSEKSEDTDPGVKNKPPLPPQHKQKADTEQLVKENLQRLPHTSGQCLVGTSTHLETTTLSAVMTEQPSNLPSIIVPDSDMSGTNAEGIRHSTPIERLAYMKEGASSLKRLGKIINVDLKDGATQSTSEKKSVKEKPPRRERRQSGVISTRVPHRSGGGGNTSFHNTSKHGRVKSAPNTSVDKLKKKLSKKHSSKVHKEKKSTNIPALPEKKKTSLTFGKNKHKSDKVKPNQLGEEQIKTDHGSVSSEKDRKKNKEHSSGKTKLSSEQNLIKKKHKRHKEKKDIIMSSGVVSYPGHSSDQSSKRSSAVDLKSQHVANTSSITTSVTCSSTNLTTASAGSNSTTGCSEQRPASALIEILPQHHHKRRPSLSLSGEMPLSIATSKKLKNLEQPPLHNKSKLDKMISVVACLSAQKSPTSRRRASLPPTGSEETTGSSKKRLWMAGARGSPEDIFGESLGSSSVGTSIYDSTQSSRMSFGGFYTGPRKRSNSDSLSECSRMDVGQHIFHKRKRRKSSTVLELSSLGANFNMDVPRPNSAMAIRKEDMSDLMASAGLLKLPIGPDGDQFTQDVLEMCKNIKESSWIQNSGGKALDSSVLLAFNQPNTCGRDTNAANKREDSGQTEQNYAPPERPDVNEKAPKVLDIISRINRIAKDSNNNSPLELCVPKSYFSPAGAKRGDNVKGTDASSTTTKPSVEAETPPNNLSLSHSEHTTGMESSLEEADYNDDDEDNDQISRPLSKASGSATFIVHSSPDVTIEDEGPGDDDLIHSTSMNALQIAYDDSINTQLISQKADQMMMQGNSQNASHTGPTPSEDERTVNAIMSKYIPVRQGMVAKREAEMRRETGRGSSKERRQHLSIVPQAVGNGGAADIVVSSGEDMVISKQIRRQNQDRGASFPFKDKRRWYDPSTEAALLSNREEKTPCISPCRPLDLRVKNPERESNTAVDSERSSLLEEASHCMQQASRMQNKAFTHLVQHLSQQQAFVEKLQKEINSQRKERLAAESILRNLTETSSVKKS